MNPNEIISHIEPKKRWLDVNYMLSLQEDDSKNDWNVVTY